MPKLFMLFVMIFSLVRLCFCSEIDYQLCSSIEEVIEFETSCILGTPSYDYEGLSDAYASRGESFFLYERFNEALSDFQQAYSFANVLENKNSSQVLIFRSLFGQALAYGSLNKPEMVIPIVETLHQMMCSMRCLDSDRGYLENIACSRELTSPSILLCGADAPIYGPDHMSQSECIETVRNTVASLKFLISKSPSSVRGILTFTIDQLGDEAKKCCRLGGVWKGCLQKLCNKLHQWNQKWKVFGIPPDPTWD